MMLIIRAKIMCLKVKFPLKAVVYMLLNVKSVAENELTQKKNKFYK